jgi:hypothetical protein
MAKNGVLDRLISSLIFWIFVSIMATPIGMAIGTFQKIIGSWQAWLVLMVPFVFMGDFGEWKGSVMVFLMLYNCMLVISSLLTILFSGF